jgi:hypothetical protein
MVAVILKILGKVLGVGLFIQAGDVTLHKCEPTQVVQLSVFLNFASRLAGQTLQGGDNFLKYLVCFFSSQEFSISQASSKSRLVRSIPSLEGFGVGSKGKIHPISFQT